MKIEENVSLRRYTSVHIGGPARYFAHIVTREDLHEAVQLAYQKNLPFFALGKGSNTLFPDEPYPGVVVYMANRALMHSGQTVTAESGVFMRQLVNFALRHNLTGLEELAGIPGTVGGSVRGNAGTWSTEIKDVVRTVEVFRCDRRLRTVTAVDLTAADCTFGYRSSLFKSHPELIIWQATFVAPPGDVTLGAQLVLKDLRERHERQPYHAPSLGSVFKNPDKAKGIFSGDLIEKAGLKGVKVGGAAISTKHANFIINTQQATSSDVRLLITTIQSTVEAHSGVRLEPEIEIVAVPPAEVHHP